MIRLTEAMREFVNKNTGNGVLACIVTVVDDQEYTFDCKDGAGNDYLDVRTNAIPGESGIIALPKVGASVLISDLGNQDQDHVMIHAGEISRIYLHVDMGTQVFVDDKNIFLGAGQTRQPAVLGDALNTNLNNLLDRIQELLTQLNTFSAIQGAASTGPLAGYAPAYATLSAQLVAAQGPLAQLRGNLQSHHSFTVQLVP